MLPQLVTIGSFILPTYGVLVVTGLLVGLLIANRLGQSVGIDKDHVTNLGVYLALSAILGAKLFMILSDWGYYLNYPSQIFSLATLRAGGVFYGGLLAAFATAFWFSRKHGLRPMETADVFAPAVAIGHSIGRLGCFAAGCCWGKPTSMPWGITFTNPAARDYVGVPLNIHLHPTQLYEAGGTLLVGLFLLWRSKKPHPPGVIVGLYLVVYSGFRFVVESFRAESGRSFPFEGALSSTQWIAILLIGVGVVLLMRQYGRAAGSLAEHPAD